MHSCGRATHTYIRTTLVAVADGHLFPWRGPNVHKFTQWRQVPMALLPMHLCPTVRVGGCVEQSMHACVCMCASRCCGLVWGCCSKQVIVFTCLLLACSQAYVLQVFVACVCEQIHVVVTAAAGSRLKQLLES
jgi:hypothetical protein